jgi:ATP-binding cassette subfamily B (MDR/TAP) protein 1
VAYIRSWRLALALSSIFPSFVLTGALLAKFSAKWITLSLAHVAEGGTIAEEVISSIRTAHAFGYRSKSVLGGIYEEKVNKAERVDLKLAMVQGIGIGVFFFTIYAAYALSFSFGTTLILQGRADAGVVVTVFMALAIGAVSFVVLGPLGQAILKATGAASKLFATIDRVPSIDSADGGGERLPREGLRGEIEFKDVGFSYPSRQGVDILKSFSLTFKAGKTTALVGSSGSGKSTIISLIERFYDPTAGSVRLDGHDLKELNLGWFRSQIGLVEQEPVLFSTTVGENVAFGLIGRRFSNNGEEIGEEEKKRLVREACIKANADEFIRRLPDGYDTLVGEGGVLLSGGQKRMCGLLAFFPSPYSRMVLRN